MLKFFATNRAIDRLERAIGKRCSEENDNPAELIRHQLSKCGYYFVDMEEYMHFYLATTDADEMPVDAVICNSQQTVFDNFLSNNKIGAVVVCVHGFNVKFHEAFTWFRILTDTMKNIHGVGEHVVTSPADLVAKQHAADGSLTAFIGFSWPSNGRVLSYLSDQREAVDSKAPFAALLARLKSTGKSVNLICHSMGNFLACHTLAALVDKHTVPPDVVTNQFILALFERGQTDEDSGQVTRAAWLIDNFVMIAPDVERRHVTRCGDGQSNDQYWGQFYCGLKHLARHKVNLYSRFDSVMTLSNIEKASRELGLAVTDAASKLTFGLLDFLERNPDQRWEKRLGEGPAPVNAAPGFISVNATELANRKIGHSDHVDAQAVVDRIAGELQIGTSSTPGSESTDSTDHAQHLGE